MASIRRRPTKRGVTWQVCFRAGGKQTSETFATEGEALTFRAMVELAGGWPPDWTPGLGAVAPDAPPERLTLDQWAPRAIAARPRASEATRADYLRDYRLHVAPQFGARPLDGPEAITREEARLWLVELRERRAAKTCANVLALVASIYKAAMEDGHASGNPFANIGKTLPKAATEDMHFLTPTEFVMFRELFHPHYRPLVTFAAHTGMRLAEFTALRVGDIDTDHARVMVERSWHRQPDNSYRLGPPKTRRSRRMIRLGSEAMEAAEEAGRGAQLGDWLFRTMGSTRGWVRHGMFRSGHWRPAVERALDLGILATAPRIHDLRHTHASWLLNAGVPIRVVQARLGHESITTTVDLYGHLEADADDLSVQALDAMRARPRLTVAR